MNSKLGIIFYSETEPTVEDEAFTSYFNNSGDNGSGSGSGSDYDYYDYGSGSGCPTEDDVWVTDDTLRVTPKYDGDIQFSDSNKH